MSLTSRLVCAVTLLLALSVLSAEASLFDWIPSWGRCQDLRAKQSFYTNINKFLQTWHVQSSSNTEFLQGNSRCMSVHYKYNNYTRVVKVVGRQYKESVGWEDLEASAAASDVSRNEAKFSLTFTIPVYGKMIGAYTVLDTDYENYAVVHGCGTIFRFFHYDCSWLMSRKQQLTAEEEGEYYKQTSRVLGRYRSLGEFKKVDQSNC